MLLQALIGGRGLLFVFPGLCLLAAAALVGLATAARSRAQADSRCLYSAGIFLGYLLLRAICSPGYFARPDLFSIVGVMVVYGTTVTLLTSSRARLGIVGALLAFAVIHVLIGIVQFTRGDNFMPISWLQRVDYGQRASGFYVCPNHLAGLLEVVGIFGLSLTCWSRWPLWAKLLAGYATGACYAGLALTGSRGGYISAVASLIVFALSSLVVIRRARAESWTKLAVIGAIALFGVLGTVALVVGQSGYLRERAENIIDRKNVRFELWRAAVQQWKLQPVFGTGSGSYRFYGRQFRAHEVQNDPVDVHNDYLHLLCEYGILGGAAFVLFFAAHARQASSALKHFSARSTAGGGSLLSNHVALQLGAMGAIAAYVVHSALDFNLHIPANAMLLAFVFGIVANPGATRPRGAEEPALPNRTKNATASLAVTLLILCFRYLPAEYYTERARAALRDEAPDLSIAFAEKALTHDRRNPQLYFYIGRAFLALAHQSGAPEERLPWFARALEAFTNAHRLAPLDGSYPLNLAFTYDELGRFEEAEHMYELARKRDPRSLTVKQLYQAHLEAQDKIGAAKVESL